jgi:hypothetical protein
LVCTRTPNHFSPAFSPKSLKDALRKSQEALATCLPASPAGAIESLFGINTRGHADNSFDADLFDVLGSPLARFLVGARRCRLDNGRVHVTAACAASALAEPTALLPLLERHRGRLVAAITNGHMRRGEREHFARARAQVRAPPQPARTHRHHLTRVPAQARFDIAKGRASAVHDAPAPPCIVAALQADTMKNDVRFSTGAVASAYLQRVGPQGGAAVDALRAEIADVFGARRAAHFAYHANRQIAERLCCTMTSGAGLRCTASPELCMQARVTVRAPLNPRPNSRVLTDPPPPSTGKRQSHAHARGRVGGTVCTKIG